VTSLNTAERWRAETYFIFLKIKERNRQTFDVGRIEKKNENKGRG
jgi:hypothetical protein